MQSCAKHFKRYFSTGMVMGHRPQHLTSIRAWEPTQQLHRLDILAWAHIHRLDLPRRRCSPMLPTSKKHGTRKRSTSMFTLYSYLLKVVKQSSGLEGIPTQKHIPLIQFALLLYHVSLLSINVSLCDESAGCSNVIIA